MNEPESSASAEPASSRKPTPLPKVGCLICLLGLGGTPLLIAVAKAAADGSGRLTGTQRLLLLLTDGTRLLVFIGLIVFLIGIFRRWKERQLTSP